MLRDYWKAATDSAPCLEVVLSKLDAVAPPPEKAKSTKATATQSAGVSLRMPAPGRRTSTEYPFAAIFRFVPCAETLAAFRAATNTLCDARDKQTINDYIAESREDDTPHFSYFTNLVFHPDSDAGQQAAWKEFDHAAFVAAITAPHRYYQDTQKRLKEVHRIEAELRLMESEGRAGSADEDDNGQHGLDGFSGDGRITRLIAVLHSDLGHLGEVDSPDDNEMGRTFTTATITRLGIKLPDNSREYTLRERTLRSWRAVRDAWRDLHEESSGPSASRPRMQRIRRASSIFRKKGPKKHPPPVGSGPRGMYWLRVWMPTRRQRTLRACSLSRRALPFAIPRNGGP